MECKTILDISTALAVLQTTELGVNRVTES
jgi:hypothetical protein